MTSGMNVCDDVYLLVKWSLYLRVIVMCSEPLFIIIQLRVYRREEIIRTRNGSAHSAQSISVSSTSAWQFRQSTCPVNKHILLVLVDIFNSHVILHLLLRFRIEGDTKMCVTDYCPHSYSYRMILIRISFHFHIARSFLHLAYCTWINYWTCPHLWYHQESEVKWLFSLLFARRKNLISVSSFACWNCPLPQTCLPCAWAHTVDLFSMVCCSCIHCWTCPHLF